MFDWLPWYIIACGILMYEPLAYLLYDRKSLLFIVTKNNLISRHKPNYIGMLPTFLSIPYIYKLGYKRFFISQLSTLLNKLRKNVIYTTNTHDILIRQLQHQERLGKIEIIKLKPILKNGEPKMRMLFLEKIQLFNVKNLFERKQEYEVVFRVIQ